ncbi:hypothetical protein Vadar_001988 [Vaccinium darrowii]|uniref:Uncharacterized protein n=1 Tax=Vaccinium darrowii TaxID=229202 RepID=A0ACB7Z8S6_9ERIC|nr:hypothetical protein Vadar_001988 [Vaccinium darrowii]
MASSAIPLLFIFLSLLPFLPLFAASNVTLGSSLSTTDDNPSWVSPSGDFAFGFRQLNNTNTFLLAIWYAQIPDQTIVWHANTTSPVQTGSNIKLTANGLTLTDRNGLTIWTAQPNTTINFGAMLDTGNSVLSGNSTGVYVWQSFDYPTDTILPTQILPLGGMLYSKLSKTNYTKGRFELHLMNNGSLQLNPVAWPTEYLYNFYYSSGTANSNSSLSGFQLVFSQSADIYILLRNGLTVQLWPDIFPNSNNYYRATLEFDGVFREYACATNSSGNQSWSVVGYIPENICLDLFNAFVGSGACGYNSYCTANGAATSCQCPPGFSLIDPNNEYGGCGPDFPPDCGVDNGTSNAEDLYDMTQVPNVNFPSGDYDILGPYNESQCGQACLQDCNCAVATFNGTFCWKKRLPMSNGRVDTALLLRALQHSVARRDFSEVFLEASEKIKKYHTQHNLANFLFGIPRPDWYQRVQVALGIARGLVYLHEECSTPIIHCDIKPQNILIDELFIPRISDFGLAKSLAFNQTRTHTGIRGTRGYVAPEWFRNVPVTVKVDVYSFGVMLLEIICCRKSVAQEFEDEERAILTDWAYDCLREGTLDALVDGDATAMSDIKTLQRWVMIAIWCIQENPLQRPTMSMVTKMLEGYVEVPIPI